MISGSWMGGAELKAALNKVAAEANLAAKTILVKSAATVVTRAQHNFQGARKYTKGPRGGRVLTPAHHTGGSKPNIITGYLRRSIHMDPIVYTGFASYSTRVGPDAIYGRRVELGFKGSRGYPYFEPAAVEASAEFYKIAVETWAKILR
jgi:hypothetical protein